MGKKILQLNQKIIHFLDGLEVALLDFLFFWGGGGHRQALLG